MRKNHILVGTPGRLIQHVNSRSIKVGEVKYLVFDESDQMFDLGFSKDCSYLRTRVSTQAQIILSSATITNKTADFIEEVIGEHELLIIGTRIPPQIIQEKVYCDKDQKLPLLLKLFSLGKFKRAIIFCNTKVRSMEVFTFLTENHLKAKTLNSDLEQQERLNILNLFKDGKIPILIATDLAARGLQIEKVDLIINYDIPTRAEFYVHRIGRTGRGEHKGYALSLICPEDVERFDLLEKEYNLEIKSIDSNLNPLD